MAAMGRVTGGRRGRSASWAWRGARGDLVAAPYWDGLPRSLPFGAALMSRRRRAASPGVSRRRSAFSTILLRMMHGDPARGGDAGATRQIARGRIAGSADLIAVSVWLHGDWENLRRGFAEALAVFRCLVHAVRV